MSYRDYRDTHDTRDHPDKGDDRFQKTSTVERSKIRKKGVYPDYLFKPSKYSKNGVDKDDEKDDILGRTPSTDSL
jgi:hypothetical protein